MSSSSHTSTRSIRPRKRSFSSGEGNVHRFQLLQHGKRHLKLLRPEGSFFQLVLQGGHGPLQNPLQAGDNILVARIVKKHRFSVGDRIGLHRLLYQAIPLFLGKIEPAPALFLQFFPENLQHAVEQVAHVHRLKAVALPFLKHQPILQEVGIGAGGILLQPADASKQGTAKQRQRRLSGQRSVPVAVESFFPHLLRPVLRFFLGNIDLV